LIRGDQQCDFESKSELISLNLIYDYPVQWNKYKVLRDLIQNFYDAVPKQEWKHRFTYDIQERILSLKAIKVGFSYEWLIPIGASTKRDGTDNYAGYFGEGFKIASLCASRDHGWAIEVASRGWQLKVTTTEVQIDDHSLKSLAYQLWHSQPEASDTVLYLYPFDDHELLDSVLLSFYYPSNPLLGEEIWESSEVAVYFRSPKPKPYYYPSTYSLGGQGIIFAGYQALGSFPYPLVFCLHRFRLSDRERNSFYEMDVIKLIHQAVSKLPSKPSAIVLRALMARWYDRPRKKYDFTSWHGIIKTLANNVSSSTEEAQRWRQEYPNLLVAKQVKRSNIPEYNRRRQALDWMRSSGQSYRLVQNGFLSLEYPTLEEACAEADGFSVTREPNKNECQYIQHLEGIITLLLPELLSQIELPPCKIIKKGRGAWQGMASCIPVKASQQLRFRGLIIRYRLAHVALKGELLDASCFGIALSTYLHELAHMFGSDGSASFSHALSVVLDITLSNSDLISQEKRRWESID
jgi:hypothetical protein